MSSQQHLIQLELQNLTLELTITHKQLYILQILKQHSANIHKITVLSNQGCSLEEIKSITCSSQVKHSLSGNILSQFNNPLPLTKQPQPYRFIHQLLVNSSHYIYFFTSTLRQELKNLQKTYEIQFKVNLGVLSVKSCKALSPFFKKQFNDLYNKFKCFISKCPHILKKLKYSKLLSEKIWRMKIHFNIIIHNSKQSVIFYNKHSINQFAMANIVEEICQGSMTLVSLAYCCNESDCSFNPFTLISAVLRQEIQTIQTAYHANIEFNPKKEVALIHNQHECFSNQTAVLFKEALNSLLIFTIEAINKTKALAILQQKQNLNIQWFKVIHKDQNILIAINSLHIHSQQFSKIKNIFHSILLSKSKFHYIRTHYSRNKLRNNFKYKLIDLANHSDLNVIQKASSKNKNSNFSNLSVSQHSQNVTQPSLFIIENLIAFLKQQNKSNIFKKFYNQEAQVIINEAFISHIKNQTQLKVSA